MGVSGETAVDSCRKFFCSHGSPLSGLDYVLTSLLRRVVQRCAALPAVMPAHSGLPKQALGSNIGFIAFMALYPVPEYQIRVLTLIPVKIVRRQSA